MAHSDPSMLGDAAPAAPAFDLSGNGMPPFPAYTRPAPTLLGALRSCSTFNYYVLTRYLGAAERTALAMTCKSFYREIFRTGSHPVSDYVPILSRANYSDPARSPPLTHREKVFSRAWNDWLTAYDRDLIGTRLVFCSSCGAIHSVDRVQDGVSNHQHRCNMEPQCLPKYMRDFGSPFHPLRLYHAYREGMRAPLPPRTKRQIQARSDEEDPYPWLDPDLFPNTVTPPLGTVLGAQFESLLTYQGIFLKEERVVRIRTMEPFFPESLTREERLCEHVRLRLDTSWESNLVSRRDAVTISSAIFRQRCGLYIRQSGGQMIINFNNQPFGELYGCTECNREWLLQPLEPLPDVSNMYAGLRIITWMCVAWFSKTIGMVGQGASQRPLRTKDIKECLANPSRRADHLPPPLLRGTCANAFGDLQLP